MSILVRKDLSAGMGQTDRKRQPPIRPASAADVLSLLGQEAEGALDADNLWERRLRRHVAVRLGGDGCFVAEGAGDGVTFMQYLFTAKDNGRLRAAFHGYFSILAEDVASVEYLYIHPGSRNPGFAVSCLMQVADEARRRGVISLISFIDPTNKAALFINHLAGFRADSVRRSSRYLLLKSHSFEHWPSETSGRLDHLASGRASIS